MTFTTTDGRTIEVGGPITYLMGCRTGSIVWLDEARPGGRIGAGPAVTPETWAAIQKAQRAIRDWCRADSKATGYYKQSRYWIVNPGTASDKQIEQAIDRMNLWEGKRAAAAQRLAEMGVTGW